jgi:hypothetical protein
MRMRIPIRIGSTRDDLADEDEAPDYAIASQCHRRNLNDRELAAVLNLMDGRWGKGMHVGANSVRNLAQSAPTDRDHTRSSEEIADKIGSTRYRVETVRSISRYAEAGTRRRRPCPGGQVRNYFRKICRPLMTKPNLDPIGEMLYAPSETIIAIDPGATAMSQHEDQDTTTTRISKALAERIRLVAAALNTSAVHVLDRIADPTLGELEREHILSRFRATERPARTPAK